jgi:hypothetical protein
MTELREAAERVIRATEANRDAINGVGHPEPHDRMLHFEPCTDLPGVEHVYEVTHDCAACGGWQYGTEDELHAAMGDLRAACGYERRPWEYERPAPLPAIPGGAS